MCSSTFTQMNQAAAAWPGLQECMRRSARHTQKRTHTHTLQPASARAHLAVHHMHGWHQCILQALFPHMPQAAAPCLGVHECQQGSRQQTQCCSASHAALAPVIAHFTNQKQPETERKGSSSLASSTRVHATNTTQSGRRDLKFAKTLGHGEAGTINNLIGSSTVECVKAKG